jgi:hypothetical protein
VDGEAELAINKLADNLVKGDSFKIITTLGTAYDNNSIKVGTEEDGELRIPVGDLKNLFSHVIFVKTKARKHFYLRPIAMEFEGHRFYLTNGIPEPDFARNPSPPHEQPDAH